MDAFSAWLSTFGVIFAIIDPFGFVPIFLSMTATDTKEKRRWMVRRACVAAFSLLAFFTLFGDFLLSFFGISIPALQISGGIILLIIGFDMVRVLPINAKISSEEETEAAHKDDISIVPLAIPMLSGPASLTTVTILGSRAQTPLNYIAILTSVGISLVITYIILRSAETILKRVGVTGLHIVTRVMGLLLCAMAVQFMINGYLGISR
jgi:multiple antibiotic resistance protein